MLNKRDAQDQGKASDDKAGGPGSTGTQASDDAGRTSPNSGEATSPASPVVLDPQTKYILNPNKPDEVFTAQEILERANRGALLDKTQSNLHKLQSQMTERETALKKAEEALANADTRLGDIDLKATIKRNLEEMGVEFGKKPAEDDYGMGLTDAGTPVNPEKLLLMVENSMKEAVAKGTESGQKAGREAALSELKTTKAQQEALRISDEFVGRTFRTNVSELRNVLPDAPEQEVQDIAKLGIGASALEMEANRLLADGKAEEADALWSKAHVNRREAFELEAKARKQQEELTAEKERSQQVEMISAGSMGGLPKYEDGPTQNKKKSRDRAKERLEKAREMEAQMKKYGP